MNGTEHPKAPSAPRAAARGLAAAAGLGTCGLVFAAWAGRGSPHHELVAGLAGVAAFFLVPAGLGLAVWASTLPPSHRGRVARGATLVLGAALVLGLLRLSVLPGALLRERDLDDALAYCESLVPTLEAYRARTGAYPEELDRLGAIDRPRHLRDCAGFYAPADGHFSFVVPTDHLFTVYEYDSRLRRWTLEHH